MKKVLIISDNPTLSIGFLTFIRSTEHDTENFVFKCSAGSEIAMSEALGFPISSIKVKTDFPTIISNHNLVISLHCKQLFPKELVGSVRCINVHPGLNPFNRGWFPQVFSILNGLPTGATIHEIDEHLDHGNIIAQKEVPNFKWDTSIDIYNRVLEAELELIRQHLPSILNGSYTTIAPSTEGNVNLKKDFNELCKLDLTKKQTVSETIDLLRALTHGTYQNAYFIDPESGEQIYVSVQLNRKK